MDNDDEVLIANVLRELGVTQEQVNSGQRVPLKIFSQVLSMPGTGFKRLGLDAAVAAGTFDDWESAFQISERLLKEGDTASATKLWHIKSLVELERFSEALALATPVDWPQSLRVHADFLTATCFDRLKMKAQAQSYYENVKKLDPEYPGLFGIEFDS